MRLGGRPFGLLRNRIKARTTSYTITRSDSYSVNAIGDRVPSTSTHSEDLWLHQPNEINMESEFGERLEGDLNGIALGEADIEPGDRVDHGTDLEGNPVTYEIDNHIYLPHNDDKKIVKFSLVKVTNS